MNSLRDLILVLALAVLVVLSGGDGGALAGETWQWRQSGYGGGGRFTAAAIDPGHPDTVFLGSDVAGLFRSTDGGARFTPLGRGLTGLAVADILIAPEAGALLVLTDDGLFASRDGGDSWRVITRDIRYPDRQPGSHLLLAAPEGSFYATSDTDGVFRLTRDGEDWRAAPLGLTGLKVNALAVFDRTLYAATDQGVQRLTGDAFEPCDLSLPPDHRRITDIGAAVDGLYCLEKDTGLYLLSGGRWTARGPAAGMSLGKGRPSYKNMAVHPDRPGHIVVATHPDSWPHELFETTDAGTTWRQIRRFDLAGGPPNWATGLESTERIVFSPDGRFGILTDWWNVWRSRDAGETWQQCHQGLQNTVVNAIAVHPADPDRLYLATADNGLMVTTDGGAHWRRSMAGVVDGHAMAVALAPGREDTVYLLMVPWQSPDTADTAFFHLYRSDDAGTTWRLYRLRDRRRTLAAPYVDGRPHALLVDPANPDRVLVAVSGYGLYAVDTAAAPGGGDVPADNLTAGLPTPYFAGPHSLLAPAAAPGTLLVATLEGGIFRTMDGGLHWQQLPGSRGFVFALAADPADPAHQLAAAAEKTLLESRDGGATWTSRPLPGDRPDYQPASDVVFGPPGSGLVAVGTSAYDSKTADGLYVSTDGGATFARAASSLPEVGINVLAVPVGQATAVLVGFNGLGLYTAAKAP